MSPRYPWLIFDADNTLYDFDAAERNAFVELMRSLRAGNPEELYPLYQNINHAVWHDFEAGRINADEVKILRFRRLFEQLGLDADADAASKHYLSFLGRHNELLEGAREIVARLSRRHRLLLLTNGLTRVQRARFGSSEIAPFFEHIIISEEVGAVKPQAAIFDIAFARMGHPAKKDVLMIGDKLSSDIAGGQNYGLDTVWYNPGRLPLPARPRPTYTISALRELPALVD